MADPELDHPDKINLPVRLFMYTLDQIAAIMNIRQSTLEERYLYYERRTVGSQDKGSIRVVNIAPEDAPPEWRASEKEVIRFLKYKGFKFGPRGMF